VSLPPFIAPMLATAGEAFDSEVHYFEIKWDGTRTLIFVDRQGYRLFNRRRIEVTDRYPELACLAALPAGTVLDAETVVLRDGKPDFALLMSREHARTPLKVRTLARALPATLMAFDLLYENFTSLMNLELAERRPRLEALLRAAAMPQLVLSDGVIGPGKAFFAEVCKRGLEGVVAKRLNSRYLPGQRSDAWVKVKRGDRARCAVIGFVLSTTTANDFRNLLLAEEDDSGLHYVGKVGTGFSDAVRRRLNELLGSRLRPKPVVPCKIRGKWIEPGLYCTVRFMERTPRGELRMPVFEELFVEEGHVIARKR
jgi:DNA ligase D-like protein (predicted ligase)